MPKSLWSAWKKLLEPVGNFQITVIFSILYSVLFFPLGMITRFKDFLKIKGRPSWEAFSLQPQNMEEMKNQ
jgi:hypothetical protein